MNERNGGVLPQVRISSQLWGKRECGTRGNNLYFKFEIIRFVFLKMKTRHRYRVYNDSSIANTGASLSLTLLDVSVKLTTSIDYIIEQE